MGRLMIIGLDALDPRVAFETHARDMPNLTGLAARGASGRLRSTYPPITVPAWVSMTTGLDPGELGLYGFGQRVAGSYEERIADSRDVEAPRIWDLAGRHGLESVVLGVPLTYPPHDIHGLMVSGPLTPGPGSDFTRPAWLGREIEERFGPYVPDVTGLRDGGDVEDRILAMSAQRFEMAEWLCARTRWDLFMMVDMGVDRFQHAFMRCLDASHPAWRGGEPDPGEVERGRAFLSRIDAMAGRLVDLAGGETTVMIVSDHGARSLEGGFAINEWLARQGHLALVDGATGRLVPGHVDWPRTTAWGEGGYVGRIHLNMQGREPGGVVDPDDADRVCARIARGLEALKGPDGRPLEVRASRPGDLYRVARGIPPDLTVEIGRLAWRAVTTVGRGVFLEGNDTGPDDANHDHEGVIVMAGPGVEAGSRLDVDIAEVFGIAARVLGVEA